MNVHIPFDFTYYPNALVEIFHSFDFSVFLISYIFFIFCLNCDENFVKERRVIINNKIRVSNLIKLTVND